MNSFLLLNSQLRGKTYQIVVQENELLKSECLVKSPNVYKWADSYRTLKIPGIFLMSYSEQTMNYKNIKK